MTSNRVRPCRLLLKNYNHGYQRIAQVMDLISQGSESLHLEYNYFGITKCMNMLPDENQQNDEEMIKMKSYLDELLRQTDV